MHPAVYLYSKKGQYKIVSFYAVVALILEFDKDKELLHNFIKNREYFEKILLDYDYFISQIVRKYRRGTNSYPYIKEFFVEVIKKLAEGKPKDEVIDAILKENKFEYLTFQKEEIDEDDSSKEFSPTIKSAVFIRDAMQNALKCKICNGYIHRNSISIDHIKRKSEGGLGIEDNGQITHPYCNTTYKN